MHMSDALISPLVGGTTLVGSSGLLGYSIRSVKIDSFEERLPLMGVMGAFLFAAQMINFAIPGTGSSGHIGGGMLLAIVLGPAAGFLTMACVLLIQALFFADGGFLAFGCNLINLGLFTAYVAYPLIFKPIAAKFRTTKGLMIGSIVASIIGLQLGSLGVVIETWLSGRAELPFTTFLMFMQPIHLAIGIAEGLITGIIVSYVYSQNRQLIFLHSRSPLINDPNNSNMTIDSSKKKFSKKTILIRLFIAALMIGGLFSLYASSNPDGLEWAVLKTSGLEEVSNDSVLNDTIKKLQENVSLMADYQLGDDSENSVIQLSGIIGSILTLFLAFGVGKIINGLTKRKSKMEEAVE